MKTALLTTLLPALALAIPTTLSLPNPTALAKRGGAGIIELVMLINELVENKHNAYDPDVADKAIVFMETTDGANCNTTVLSKGYASGGPIPYDTLTPPKWEVCYLGGEQHFHADSIGDFSITFTRAGGVDGDTRDGLHTPILRVANIKGDLDVDGLSQAADNKICTRVGNANGRIIAWKCGIPTTGHSFFGLSNAPPVTATTYTPGWCGVHIVQHQITDVNNGKYGIAALIKDDKGLPIGMLGDPYTTDKDPSAAAVYDGVYSMGSVLPYTLEIGVGKIDDDGLTFGYAGASWDTGANNGGHYCSVGVYDGGSRSIDCGFTC